MNMQTFPFFFGVQYIEDQSLQSLFSREQVFQTTKDDACICEPKLVMQTNTKCYPKLNKPLSKSIVLSFIKIHQSIHGPLILQVGNH